MASISAQPAGPDRPRRALEILAAAGEGGLTTPALTAAAGATDARALSWYGSIMREAEARGWVAGAGADGARQRGRPVLWRITDAGRGRLAEYELARSVPTTRQIAAVRRAEVAQERRHCDLALALSRAIIDGRDDLTSDEKLGLVRSLRKEGCKLQEIGDLFGRSGEYIRLALKHDAWPVTTSMMIRTEE